jgi:hypothetical protein
MVWIGKGGGSDDDRFLYVPDPDDPLTFKRSDAKAPGAVIRPGVMYTDGGSIPKIAQAFRGFSPWCESARNSDPLSEGIGVQF